MGKVVSHTGSKALGEELRRLRGGRSLSDLVDVSRSRLLPLGFKGLAKGSLSEIETGRTLPGIATVFGLSVVHSVQPSHFFHVLLDERVSSATPVPDPPAEIIVEYAQALSRRQGARALVLAVHGSRTAATSLEVLTWRFRRALALEFVGMRPEAIGILQEILEAPEYPASQRCGVHRELARMHSATCNIRMADLHMRETLAHAPEDLPIERRHALWQMQACLVLRKAELGLIERAEASRELAPLVAAEPRLHGDDQTGRMLSNVFRACIAAQQGDEVNARRYALRSLREAQEGGYKNRALESLSILGSIEAPLDRGLALQHFREAARLAIEVDSFEAAFLTCADILDLTPDPSERRLAFERCRNLLPYAQPRHPAVRQFEERLRAQAG